MIASGLGMVAKGTESIGNSLIVGDNGPGFAIRAKVLPRIEAEATAQPQRAGALVVITGPVRLGGVLDDRDAAAPADLQEGAQVGRLAVEVDREDRASPPRDLALNLADVIV